MKNDSGHWLTSRRKLFARKTNCLITALAVFAKSCSSGLFDRICWNVCLVEELHFMKKTKNRNSDIIILVLKNAPWWLIDITISLYFHVQIKMCCNEIETDNIIHVYFQAKIAKAVKEYKFFSSNCWCYLTFSLHSLFITCQFYCNRNVIYIFFLVYEWMFVLTFLVGSHSFQYLI